MRKTTRSTTEIGAEEMRREQAEAAAHRSQASEHRREAAGDRAEGAADRAEGDRLEAAGNELEAKGHDLAARTHERAAAHDTREAGETRRSASYAEAGRPITREEVKPGTGRTAGTDGDGSPLLGDEQCRRFRTRWESILASFIDEPRQAVAEADALVRDATEALHSHFEHDRRQLEGVWDRGDEVSTEDLRVTLQRYRSFFERLLSI